MAIVPTSMRSRCASLTTHDPILTRSSDPESARVNQHIRTGIGDDGIENIGLTEHEQRLLSDQTSSGSVLIWDAIVSSKVRTAVCTAADIECDLPAPRPPRNSQHHDRSGGGSCASRAAKTQSSAASSPRSATGQT
jgi:hypothetical protein